jgi:hypothetical protein
MTYTATPAKMHSGHDIRDERGHMVAIVHNPAADPAEGAHIAALMAAAPDLLAALKEMYALYADHAQYDEEGYETAAINAACAAIARATGFAP